MEVEIRFLSDGWLLLPRGQNAKRVEVQVSSRSSSSLFTQKDCRFCLLLLQYKKEDKEDDEDDESIKR